MRNLRIMRHAARISTVPIFIGVALGASVLVFSTKALAILLAGMVGVMLAASSFRVYYALVAMIPVQVDFISGVTFTKIIVPFSIAVVVANALIRRGPWPVLTLGPACYLAGAFFTASFISLVHADLGAFAGEAARVPVYASLFFLTLTFIRTPDQFRRVLWVIAFTGTIEAVITVAQAQYGFILPGEWRTNITLPIEGGVDGGALSAILEGKIRAEGTTPHPILLASYYLMTIPCTACLFLTEASRSKRFLLIGMIALMSCGWYYTFARSSMIGFALMLVVALSFYSKAARTAIFVAIGLAVTGLLSYQTISESLSAGIKTFETGSWFANADVNSASGSWQFRIESIIGGWNLFAAHPWFGVGSGQAIQHYTKYLPAWADHISHPSEIHNIFLEVGCELGILALIAFIGLWAWALVCVKYGLRVPALRPYAVLMCCMLLGQMVFVMITPMVREIWLTIPMAISLGYMNRNSGP